MTMLDRVLGRVSRRRPAGASISARLADPRRYEAEIDELHRRHLFTRRLYDLRQDDVPLASVVMDKRRVSKLIARAVENGSYEIEAGINRTIHVKGKERTIYAFKLTDLIVHRVVASIVNEAMEPLLSSGLYSYRKGMSWREPVAGLASYIREHRRSLPDPRTRGLYVLRRDIHKYADSIPVREGAPIWRMLREVLAGPDGDQEIRENDWRFIQECARPLLALEGREFNQILGVPTGQPIACSIFNLYLAEFDRRLAAVPGSFYARYSDDFLFAHPDPEVARRVGEEIDSLLVDLEIRANVEKGQDIFLTAAGRPSEAWPEAKGTTIVPFLGCLVSGTGTVALDQKKLRQFLRDVDRRARRTVRAMDGQPEERVGRAVCAAINQSTHPKNSLLGQASAPLLRRAVTDRGQLDQLDYKVARIVAGAVSGHHKVRAFRRISYKRIRKDWGLQSLLHARNKWGA
ncbi:MAG: hypothetical protein JRH19_24960 [Deltaproteobacteria bacterium]|nr:hypothetical protein [Deltaproteobacteria bacterium]